MKTKSSRGISFIPSLFYFLSVLIFTCSLQSCFSTRQSQAPSINLRPDEMANLQAKKLFLSKDFPQPEEKIDIVFEVQNQANHTALNNQILIYNGKQLITSKVLDLLPNSSTTLKTPWKFSSFGEHKIRAIIISKEGIPEIDQADNALDIKVIVATAPISESDFEISKMDTIILQNTTKQVEVTIRNNGSLSAQAPLIIKLGNKNIYQKLIGPLRPGAIEIVTIPFPIGGEFNKISALVNPRFDFLEINSANNKFQLPPSPPPKISFQEVSVHTLKNISGNPKKATLSFSIRNNTTDTLHQNFSTRIYSTALNASKFLVKDLDNPGLPPGEKIYYSHTFSNPPNRFRIDIEVLVNNENDIFGRYTTFSRSSGYEVGKWVSIGPTKLAGNLGATGRLHEVVIDPNDANIIYVGAPPGHGGSLVGGGSGIWKSQDKGQTWRPLTDALPSLTIAELSIDPSNSLRLYAVTPEGIFRSENGGDSWILVTNDSQLDINRRSIELIIHPSNPDHLWLTSSKGVFKSYNRGKNWELLNIPGGIRQVTDLIMMPSNPDVLYAAMSHNESFSFTGIYETLDGGTSWRKLKGCNSMPLPLITKKTTIKLAVSGTTIYASFKSTGPHSWTLYSSTGGICNSIEGIVEYAWPAIWSPSGTNTDTDPKPQDLWSDIYVDPTDASFVYVTGTRFYVSTNSGSSFVQGTGPHADHHGLAFDPELPQVIYTACDGGIYRSSNRGQPNSWQFIGEGLTIVEFYDISDSNTEPNLVIGGTQDNGTLKYDGSDLVWKAISGGDGAIVDIDPENSDILLAGGQNITILRTTNGESPLTPIRTKVDTDPNCFNPHYQVHPTLPNIIIESCESLWIGSSGPPWFTIFTPPEGSVVQSTVDPSINLYYAGTSQGDLYAGPAGLGWREVFSAPNGGKVTDIEIDPINSHVVYLSIDKKNFARIFRLRRNSDNPSSLTFEDITSNLPDGIVIKAIAIDRMKPLTIYIGTNKGVYCGRSNDGGNNWYWSKFNDGLPAAASITELDIHPKTGIMRASAFGRSAYEVYTDSPIGSIVSATGKISFLRVHELGTGFGPGDDHIDVEVVIKLNSQAGKTFGFQIRNDDNETTHSRMLDLLRSAFNQNKIVQINYKKTSFLKGLITRVMLLQ